MQRASRRIGFSLALVALITIATAVVLEVGARGLWWAGDERFAPLESDPASFWDPDHPVFGGWHVPGARDTLQLDCADAEYAINSVGARDRERELDTDAQRVIVLGDSVAEGWGVSADLRFSNRLEAITGVDHANFAMSHFSPYQQLLAYRELAKDYEHDAVLSTFTLANDFLDLDRAWADGLLDYEYRYRPYLVPASDGEGYQHFDHREPAFRRWLRKHSQLFGAILRWGAADALDTRPRPLPRVRLGSWYSDFDDMQWALYEHTLRELIREADGRPVAVVIVPYVADLRLEARSPALPLTQRLTALADETGLIVVDLGRGFARNARRSREDLATYAFACDPHWNARGHTVAARLIARALAGRIYDAEVVEAALPAHRSRPKGGHAE